MRKTKQINGLIQKLQALRYFSGDPNQFWSQFVALVGQLLYADYALLLVYDEKKATWRNLLLWSDEKASIIASKYLDKMQGMADKTELSCIIIDEQNKAIFFSARLYSDDDNQAVSVISFILPFHKGQLSTTLLPLIFQLIADIPNEYLKHLKYQQSQVDNDIAYEILELLTLLKPSETYAETALSLCNELARRYKFSRVSLGWVDQGYVQLQAISRINKFNKKMEFTRQIEHAMEEAADQEKEVICPNTDPQVISRNHEVLAKLVQCEQIYTLPLRHNDNIVGVLCVEKSNSSDTQKEIVRLRICCDQVTEKLVSQKWKQRWFGRRFIDFCRDKLKKYLGIEHTIIKAVAVLVSVFFMAIFFISWEYRIEAPFITQAKMVRYITAPYDTYIEEGHVKVGDEVRKKQLLVSLDVSELLLQETKVLTELSRYTREKEKARAKNLLADMKISDSLRQQAQVRLDEIRYHLNRAQIYSSIKGLVVEGDLSRSADAPVKKGDVLLKLASLDHMFITLDLDEQYIHEVDINLKGEVAFQSQPNFHFPFRLIRINPASEVKGGKNIFRLKAEFSSEIQDWWRPGMSGLAKIDIGKRPIIWILTHKTTEFLALWMWW